MRARREILTEVILSTFRVNALLLEKGNELVEPLGLTSARWQVIGAIAMSGRPLTCPQVAMAMGISRQGALKQLDLAHERGLLLSKENPNHDRSPLYELTDRGKKSFEKAMKRQTIWAGSLVQGISEADLRVTLEVLRALEARLPETPLPGE